MGMLLNYVQPVSAVSIQDACVCQSCISQVLSCKVMKEGATQCCHLGIKNSNAHVVLYKMSLYNV